MLSIRNNIVNTISVKKSKFITFLFKVDSVSDVSIHLDKLSIDYSDATHICYAYIIDNIKRFSDNGEPNGTAGMPILNVLESNNLDHVLCCVVRYFGGVKLGANGLVRAYSSCTSSAISCTSIVNLVTGKICKIDFIYDNTKSIDILLKSSIILEKEYDTLVSYVFKISCSLLDDKINEFNKLGSLTIIDDCFIELS